MLDRRRIPDALTALAVVLAGVYLVLLSSRPFAGEPVLKCLPALLLALAAWLGGSPRLFAFGLVASAVGDVFLASPGRDRFLAGLVAFLIAHLLYVSAFLLLPRRMDRRVECVAATVVLVGAAAIVLSRLWPGLGALRVPVVVYVGALLAMALAACWRRTPWAVPLGALLFVVSDSSLGWSVFVGAFPGSAQLVWSTYVAAQVLLTVGMRQQADHALW